MSHISHFNLGFIQWVLYGDGRPNASGQSKGCIRWEDRICLTISLLSALSAVNQELL